MKEPAAQADISALGHRPIDFPSPGGPAARPSNHWFVLPTYPLHLLHHFSIQMASLQLDPRQILDIMAAKIETQTHPEYKVPFLLNKSHFDVFQTVHRSIEVFLKHTLHLHTVRLFTESDDTRGRGDKIGPPDDEQRAARNMLRSVM